MPQNDQEVTLAYFQQATLAEIPATWDSDGTVVEFLALEPTRDGLGEGVVPNMNSRRRALDTLTHLPALRSGTGWGWKIYASGSQVTTANDAAAATFALADLLRNALAGRHLGFASAVVTPSTTAPDITVGQGANHPAGAAIFGVNTAAAAGEFLVVDSVAVDVLTLRTTATNAVDTVGAVIALFPHTRALPDRNHANNVTHAFLQRGEGTDDDYEILGGKLNVTGMESTEPGADARFVFEGMHTDFNSDGVTHFDLTGTPQGPAGPIVGRSGTAIRIANLGTPALTTLNAHSFTFSPGIVNIQVPGITSNGVLGYAYTPGDDTMLEIVVDYDENFITDFEAQQFKHVMIQVGDQRGDAWAIYFPRCLLMEDPGRLGTSDQTTMTLKLRAHEFQGATHTEGTDNFELENARFLILLCA